jgi:DNA-binding IclR family transcriptional regulator
MTEQEQAIATEAILLETERQMDKYKTALECIRDCGCEMEPQDFINAVRAIAMEALNE